MSPYHHWSEEAHRDINDEIVQEGIAEQGYGVILELYCEPTGRQVELRYEPDAELSYHLISVDDGPTFPQERRYPTRTEAYEEGTRLLRKQFPEVEESPDDEPSDTQLQTDRSKAQIGLEQNLERYLFDDLSDLEDSLAPFDDNSRQYSTDSGRIDVLAEDKDGNLVVVELKASEANRDALGQAMSYMADIQDEFPNKEVRGIIVAESFSQKLRRASSLQPDIRLYRYSVQFDFDRVSESQ